jgi:hypothetical protein
VEPLLKIAEQVREPFTDLLMSVFPIPEHRVGHEATVQRMAVRHPKALANHSDGSDKKLQ